MKGYPLTGNYEQDVAMLISEIAKLEEYVAKLKKTLIKYQVRYFAEDAAKEK